MWKKNFQNLETHCVYGGVDHSIQRPPVQFERLGLLPDIIININHLKNRKMKNVKIISGNFTEAGNYSAYDNKSNRYFVNKRVMENNGWSTEADVTLPFFATVITKPIGQLDANGEPLVDANGVAVTVNRDQITCIYKTKEELIQDAIDEVSLEIDIQSAIQAHATSAGLSQSRVNALLEAI